MFWGYYHGILIPFLRRNPPQWGEFSGRWMGDFYDVVCEEIPLKGKKTGRGRVDVRVEKRVQKSAPPHIVRTAQKGPW